VAAPKRENALDHVVVLMFENRSFDHLLGRLYEPGELGSFEGVIGKDLSNPIPEWAEHGADAGVVPYGVAKDMNTPYPDPGEEYPHINTQLYGHIDPPSNRGVPTEQMIAPYNAPADPDQVPTMDGFVADYISAFSAEMGRQPTYDEYSQIMTGYTPSRCRCSRRSRGDLRRSTTGSRTCRRRHSQTGRSFTPRPHRACSSTPRTRTSRFTTRPRRCSTGSTRMA
jgi:phospholipase C